MTPVEKMARAMLRQEQSREPLAWELPEPKWTVGDLDSYGFMDNAAAALKALLEPSEGMVEAGEEASGMVAWDHIDVRLRDAFTAMINHAIQEHEG